MKEGIKVLIQGREKGLKKYCKASSFFIGGIVLMCLICLLHSISAGHYADFYPINGVFQNFNPVRRLLAGQIPYRDFQIYLGFGHLYAGSFLTFLFGGDFQGSLQAFSFLSFCGLGLMSLMVSLAVVKKKEIAGAVTNLVLIIVLVEPLFFTNAAAGTSEMLSGLQHALGAGNSAKFIRGTILPLSCLLLFLGYLLYSNIVERIKKWKDLILFAGIGTVAGFAFAWSNDYGVSCWLCLLIMTFWVTLCRKRKFLSAIKALVVSLASSMLTLFFIIEVFTLGHFGKWFTSTFGTGGYQFWYYNSDKGFFLYDIDSSYIMLIQAGLAIVYLIKLFTSKGSLIACRRYGILAFANMVCFCAVNEYRILSGGESRQVALSVLFLNIIIEIGMLICTAGNKTALAKALLIGSFVVSLAWVVSTTKEEIVFFFMTPKEGVVVKELGGNLTSRGEDIKRAENFLNGSDFFATYASAQEIVSGIFQPSGTDYIIHVLGDSQREDYLKSFKTGDFKYAATIREDFTGWEYWVKRANWFFYRELYENWHPVYSNTYEMYWERNEKEGMNRLDTGCSVYILDVGESTRKITLNCDETTNGIADVYIDYEVQKKDIRSVVLMTHMSLKVENTGYVHVAGGAWFESNFLRPVSAEYIPIPVVNGRGEVTLTSMPNLTTRLLVNDLKINCVYTVAADYVTVNDIEEHDGNSVILISNSQNNQDRIADVTHIQYGEEKYEVGEVVLDEENIYLPLEDKLVLDRSNQVKIIRKTQK